MSDFTFKYIKKYSEAKEAKDNNTKAEENNIGIKAKTTLINSNREFANRAYLDTYGSKAIQVCWLGNRSHEPIEDKVIQKIADDLSNQTISVLVPGKGFEKYQLNVIDTVYDSKNNYVGLVIGKSYIGKDRKKNFTTITKMLAKGIAAGGMEGAMRSTAH